MRTRAPRVLTAVVAALLFLAGCGSDPKAPDTVAPLDYSVVQDDEAGFAVAVPSDWTIIRLTEDITEFNRTANQLRLENPELSEALVRARIVAQVRGRLYAVDSGGLMSVSLTVDNAEENTLDEIIATIRPALESSDATDLADEPENLPAGPATRLSFRIPVNTRDGEEVVDKVQYYVLKDGKLYILEIAATDPEVASTVAETLRIR